MNFLTENETCQQCGQSVNIADTATHYGCLVAQRELGEHVRKLRDAVASHAKVLRLAAELLQRYGRRHPIEGPKDPTATATATLERSAAALEDLVRDSRSDHPLESKTAAPAVIPTQRGHDPEGGAP